jgi:hypothetical protein
VKVHELQELFKKVHHTILYYHYLHNAAIGILGMNLEPTARFGYEAYFSPLLFGLISVIPSFAMYARKELSFHQILIRKIIYVILLETLLIIFGIATGLLHNISDSISFALAVFAVYLVVNVIS